MAESMKACFNNDDRNAEHTRLEKNENTQSINAVIPFGPWILCDADEWKEVDYN